MAGAATDGNFFLEVLPAFIDEAQEQTVALEQLLLQLEDAPEDRELLDALFRCAHTIKGSAGVFGLDAIVAFTHHLESLLDHLREGRLALDAALSTLLLQSNDQIRTLILAAQDDAPEAEATLQVREALVLRLRQAAAAAEPAAPAARGAAPVVATIAEIAAAEAAAHGGAGDASYKVVGRAAGTAPWQVDVRFGADTFRHGIDPLTLLNYLGGLGRISNLRCDTAAVPALDEFDPESCRLAFSFELHGALLREEIEQAFSFARDDCELMLTAPAVATAAIASTSRRATGENGVANANADGGYLRVPADRLDEVINLLGELVIAGAGATLLAKQTQQRSLIEANRQVTRLIEGIRNSTLKLRMVPIGETFARFRRVVRDTAAELGKDVLLEITGGDTELDKALVERIADPLMHLVRNALDHGLETPQQRQAAAKPSQGRLVLSACHESGSILIRIADDGRGIQRDKVLARARERGLVAAGNVPPDDEILKLIFEPGFSTAETVTNLSGRGVGMDVVRRNIEALRGTVAISSEPGAGTCIEIRLPLTLAIIDGFLVGVGPSKFIFPLDAVVEVIANRPTQTALDARGRSCVELRGELLPVVSLRTLYALATPQPERSSVVVIRAGGRRYGVMVDTLLGQHQTVIKPLGLMLRSLRGVSGSSILGSGEVALIFDAAALALLAAQPRPAVPAAHSPGAAAAAHPLAGEYR